MKKILSLVLIISTINWALSQTKNFKIVTDDFQHNYNTGNYQKIINTLSPRMKKVLSTEFLVNLKKQFGAIKQKEFIGYKNDDFANYKVSFEKAVLSMDISIDNHNLIDGFLIEPYQIKNIENNTTNALSKYPKEIVDLIYTQSKNLPNEAQLSIAILQNGKTNYYGVIKENDSLKPIDNYDKVFEIGSITKVFTSTVLANLVENRKIKLTDNINSYYSFPFNNGSKITFESLANHTSGLPRLPENLDLSNTTNPYKHYGKNEIEFYLKNLLKLNEKHYKYSNLGAGLLGYTLGISQNQNFQQLLQSIVFDQYHMNHSYTSSQGLGNRLIKGRDENGNIVPHWDFDTLFGGGGVLSSTEDLARFAKAHLDTENKVLALTRKPTFKINENMEIALGWHIIKNKKKENLFWHNGGTGGYSSSIIMNPSDKTAVIILSNVFNINENIDQLNFELIKYVENGQ